MKPLPIGDGGLLSLKQTAALLGLHPRTVVRYLRAGDLEGRIIGMRWRVRRADLDRFFEKAPRSWDWRRKGEPEE